MLTAFVVGPLVTTVSLGDYFSSWETWVYPFRITLMMPFGAQLPGVFDDNVYAGAVNGSLWSLPVEVFAYAVLAVLGVTGMLRHRKLVAGDRRAGRAVVRRVGLGDPARHRLDVRAGRLRGGRGRLVLPRPHRAQLADRRGGPGGLRARCAWGRWGLA